jgi:hypothetical protein
MTPQKILQSNMRWLLTAFAATTFVGCNTTTSPVTPPAPSTGMTVKEAQTLSNDPVAQSKDPEKSTSFDFKGSVTDGPSKDTVLEGKLSIELKTWKNEVQIFMGALVTSSANYPARGVLLKDGRIFVFLEVDAKAGAFIIGQGKATKEGGFEGTFDGPQIGLDTGTWTATPSTATPPPPPPVTTTALTYDFSAKVVSGPSKDTMIEGKLEIMLEGQDAPKPETLVNNLPPAERARPFRKFKGTLTLADGTQIPAKGAILCGKHVTVVFKLAEDGSKLIFGEGAIQEDESISGHFAIIEKPKEGEPKAADVGTWTATPVKTAAPTP